MKVQQKVLFYFFAVITLGCVATEAIASCPITQQGPPCKEYWQTEAVFIGVANRVVHTPDKPSPENWMYVHTTAYFTIEEAFKGVGGTAVVLHWIPAVIDSRKASDTSFTPTAIQQQRA